MNVWFNAAVHRPRRSNNLVFFTVREGDSPAVLYIGQLRKLKRVILFGKSDFYYVTLRGKIYRENKVDAWTYVNVPDGEWDMLKL